MTFPNSSIAGEKAEKNAALVFRKPSTLDEFLWVGLIVQRVLAGKTPVRAKEAA